MSCNNPLFLLSKKIKMKFPSIAGIVYLLRNSNTKSLQKLADVGLYFGGSTQISLQCYLYISVSWLTKEREFLDRGISKLFSFIFLFFFLLGQSKLWRASGDLNLYRPIEERGLKSFKGITRFKLFVK